MLSRSLILDLPLLLVLSNLCSSQSVGLQATQLLRSCEASATRSIVTSLAWVQCSLTYWLAAICSAERQTRRYSERTRFVTSRTSWRICRTFQILKCPSPASKLSVLCLPPIQRRGPRHASYLITDGLKAISMPLWTSSHKIILLPYRAATKAYSSMIT